MLTALLLLMLAHLARSQVQGRPSPGAASGAAGDPAGTAAEFACIDALWQQAYREWMAADIEADMGDRLRDPALVDPTPDLAPLFEELAARGEGRAALRLLSIRPPGSIATGECRFATAAELVKQHGDEDWMEHFARACLYSEPELVHALVERTRNPLVQAATLLALAEDAYSGSIQDDRDPEYVAAHAAEAERLYCELLTRFPHGRPEASVPPAWPSWNVEEWRARLFELEHLQVGHVAPALEARYADGAEVRMADLRGRIVVVYLLDQSTAEEGDLALLCDLVEQRQGMPLAVLALSRSGARHGAFSAAWPGLIWACAKNSGERRTFSIWDVANLESPMVFDARGVLRHRGVNGAALRSAVETLLAERREAATLPSASGR